MTKIMMNQKGGFCVRLQSADTFLKRLKGLMFCAGLQEQQALLLVPCSSIHTCFMKFTIDVVYLDEANTILGKETIRPWRVGKRFRGTKKILEINSGAAECLEAGEQLILRELY